MEVVWRAAQSASGGRNMAMEQGRRRLLRPTAPHARRWLPSKGSCGPNVRDVLKGRLTEFDDRWVMGKRRILGKKKN